MTTAIDIDTAVWNKIIAGLVAEGWKTIYKYDGFDAGIDFDYITLEKDGEQISFGWDNWSEGEITCSPERMEKIEHATGIKFKRALLNKLKPGVPGP